MEISDLDGQRIGIFGGSGSGKTTFAKAVTDGMTRIVYFDPQGDYAGMCKTVIDHKSADALDQVRAAMAADPSGFRICYIPPPGQEPAALNVLSAQIWEGMHRYRELRRPLDEAARTGDKKAVLNLVQQLPPKITLAMDEMNTAFPVHGGDSIVPAYSNLCSRGRASGINLIGISQGIQEVSTRFRRNANQLIILRQEGKADIAQAEAALGVPRASIEALKPFEYFHKTTTGCELKKFTI